MTDADKQAAAETPPEPDAPIDVEATVVDDGKTAPRLPTGLALLGVLTVFVLIALFVSVATREREPTPPAVRLLQTEFRAAQRDMDALAGRLDKVENDAAAAEANTVAAIENRLAIIEQAAQKAAEDAGAALEKADSEPAETAEDLAARLAELETALAALEGADAAKLVNDFATLTEGIKKETEATAALTEGQTSLAARIEELVSAQDAAAKADADAREALSARLEKLEAVDFNAEAKRTALAMALADFTQESQTGRPFARAFDTISRLTPEQDDMAAVKAYAEAGVPTARALAERFSALVPVILAAERKQNDAGLFDALRTNLSSLVTVRKVGDVEGEGTDAILARAEQRLADGDMSAAIEEVEGLQSPAAEAAADWLSDAKARLAIDALLKRLNADLAADLAG